MDLLASVAAVLAAFLTAVLFAFTTLTVYLMIARRRYSHIPTPKGSSLYFGHFLALRKAQKSNVHMFDLMTEWMSECGPVYWVAFFHRIAVVALDPESVKTLSGKNIPKPSTQGLATIFGQRFIKNSLFSLTHYEDWKERRHIFDQAFTRSYLRGLVPVFNSVVMKDLIDPLRAKADGTTKVQLKCEFSRVALQVISNAAFGADFERDPAVLEIAGKDGPSNLLTICFEGAQFANNYPLVKYFPFLGSKYATAIRKIRAIGRHCIELRLKALDSNEELPSDIMSKILSVVHIQKDLDIEDLIDEFFLFYLAGQDSISNVMSFVTGLLIQHPDILHRVMEEIEEVVGDKTTVEADDLDKLAYMNQVIEESLRLFALTFLQKEAPTGGLNLMGYNVPAGTLIMVTPYCSLRSPEYVVDPLKFNPSRFDPGQKRPNPYLYYPFGIGHRSCIARVFSMIEVKVVMVHLLRTYNLSLPENYCLKIDGRSMFPQADQLLPCFLTLKQ